MPAVLLLALAFGNMHTVQEPQLNPVDVVQTRLTWSAKRVRMRRRSPRASKAVVGNPLATIMPRWTPGLQSMFQSSGLVIRMHECKNRKFKHLSLTKCLDRELKRELAPVSIWRADLPQASFSKKGLTVGVGWVLNLSTVHVNRVNAHDSYGKLDRRCKAGAHGTYARYANATWYADTRIAYVLKHCARAGGRTFPAGYSCLTDMEVALSAQREFWRRSNELKHCQGSTMLHNEALATFTAKDILGVFLDLSMSPTNTTRDYAELAAKAAGGVPVFGLPLSIRKASDPAIEVHDQIKSAKSCLLDQTPVQTHNYLAKLYGPLNVRRAASIWSWPSVDVIWPDKLDPSVADCLMRHRTP
eukprot:scaffold52244_cov75-Phaeocystis_antarctica.AAC.1